MFEFFMAFLMVIDLWRMGKEWGYSTKNVFLDRSVELTGAVLMIKERKATVTFLVFVGCIC
jgi:hypothetical protein